MKIVEESQKYASGTGAMIPRSKLFSKMKRGKRDDRDNRDGAPIARICECAKNMLRICARHSRTTAARLLLTHVEHKGGEDDVRSG